MEFKVKFKELRELYGFSKTELAKRLGVSVTKITNFENGKSEPSYEQLLAICKMYNISFEEFTKDLDEVNLDHVESVPKPSHQLLIWLFIIIIFILFVIFLYHMFSL